MACQENYTVQADDWLSKLADKFYGDIFAYPAIFEATNADFQTAEQRVYRSPQQASHISMQVATPEKATK